MKLQKDEKFEGTEPQVGNEVNTRMAEINENI